MAGRALSDFTVLTFDVYGTLIDWETGIVAGLKPLTDRVGPALSRDRILEAHALHESEQQAATPGKPYRDLLAIVYRRLAEAWEVHVDWSECVAYGRSVPQWPAFPDTVAALRTLKRHYRLAVLSNVDNESFAGTLPRLGVPFDAVFTAEDTGAYKPADAGFRYMTAKLEQRGLPRSAILHVAESLFHDHVPATRHGLATAWIYRRHDQEGFGATRDPGERPAVDFAFDDMASFAAAAHETFTA
jgi:2-haloalkanoic acid dehalogenase type II